MPKQQRRRDVISASRCTTSKPAAKRVQASPIFVEFSAGYARAPSAKYHFVDLWSQRSTWGGGPLPGDGDSIVIPESTTVVVDMPAGYIPKLHTIILFGDLKFDEEPEDGSVPDIHLHVRRLLLFPCTRASHLSVP